MPCRAEEQPSLKAMPAPKSKKNQVSTLTPNSIVVAVDGEDVRVAVSKDENQIQNMILASQMRHIFQQNLKKYKDMETHMTPREMKDLADTAAAIARFSGEVYATSDSLGKPPTVDEKNVTESVDDISFDKAIEPAPEAKPVT